MVTVDRGDRAGSTVRQRLTVYLLVGEFQNGRLHDLGLVIQF